MPGGPPWGQQGQGKTVALQLDFLQLELYFLQLEVYFLQFKLYFLQFKLYFLHGQSKAVEKSCKGGGKGAKPPEFFEL